MNGWEYKISGPLWCLLIVFELSWSQCLKSLTSDSKLYLYHSWKVADHSQMMLHRASCDNRMWSCWFHNRLQQNERAIGPLTRAGGHDMQGHGQKESKRGLALFYILIHQQIFKNYCSSAWEPWQRLPLSAEGVCELRWTQYRNWLCFPKMKFTKKKDWLIQRRLISSVSIWLSWPHREREDW